jgi:hypothetical protein
VQDRILDDRAADRLGIMRRNDPAGQRDVGQILAIGVERWVGRVRRAVERKFLSAGGRRPGLVR